MEANNQAVQKLVQSIKRYLGLQKTYIQLELAEKLTLLLTAFILGCIIFTIGLIAVIFLALTICALLNDWLGNEALSYLIMTCMFVLACVILYFKRKPWIVNPLTQFFAQLLMSNTNENEK